MKSNNFYYLLYVIDDLCRTTLKKLDEYGKLHNYKQFFHNIDYVYMHSIILDIAKVTSATRSDKSGIKQLKEYSSEEMKNRINNFEIMYYEIITKIKSNRDRIIAHVDISNRKSFLDMGFSKIEINKKIKGYREFIKNNTIFNEADLAVIEDLKKLKSKSIDNERYSPSDFSKDVVKFKKMMKEILEIAYSVNDDIHNFR